MDENEIYALEGLLGKLMSAVKHRVSVVPNTIMDGFHIGIYANNGELKYQSNQKSLRDCINDIQSKFPDGEKASWQF